MASLLELEADDDACSEEGFAFDGERSDTGSDLDELVCRRKSLQREL